MFFSDHNYINHINLSVTFPNSNFPAAINFPTFNFFFIYIKTIFSTRNIETMANQVRLDLKIINNPSTTKALEYFHKKVHLNSPKLFLNKKKYFYSFKEYTLRQKCLINSAPGS